LPYLIKVTIWLTPGKEREEGLDELHHIKFMDSKFVEIPSVALGQAQAEIIRMGEAVQLMYDDVINSVKERELKGVSKWRKREQALDNLQREITQFLVRVMQGAIGPEESREVRSLIRMTNNLERVGDATENIAELIEDLAEQDLYLSQEALNDYEEISDEARKFLALLLDAMRDQDKEIMPMAREIEDNINRMEEGMKESHLLRLQAGVCALDSGRVFVNMLAAFERMGRSCFNISQAVAGLK